MNEGTTFQTLDLYLSSFLAFHGIQPTLENINGKVVFFFPASEELYQLIARYNSNEAVPVNSFVTVIKMLRAQLLSLRGSQ